MNRTSPETPRRPSETPTPQAGLSERERRSQAHVESVEERNKRLVAMRGKNKETLYQNWLKNNEKNDKPERLEDPRYLAMREIPESMVEDKAEAAALLHMYEKFLGDRKQALELYKKCWVKGKFHIANLREAFTREKTLGKTGFYFGKRKIAWNYDSWTTRWRMADRIKAAGFSSEHIPLYKKGNGEWVNANMKLVTVTGWWAHDIDEKNEKNSYVDGGYYVEKDLLSKLRKGGYGDEWLGKSFKEAVASKTFKAEINPNEKANRDNQLTPRQETEILKEIQEALKFHTGEIYKDKLKEDILDAFLKQTPDKWFTLPDDLIGKMGFVYGSAVVNPTDYMYRYSADKKKIYFIRIDGRKIEGSDFGGYIEIDEKAKPKKTLKDWKGLNQKDTEKELKTLIDSMKDDVLVKELMDYGQKVEGVSLLDRTKGMAVAIPAFKKGVPYNNLEKDFYEPLRKNLDAKLEKEGLTVKENREKYVEARIEDIKKQLEKLIEENSMIQSAAKDKPDVKLSIDITNDTVKVDLAHLADKTKYRGVLDAAKAAKDSVEEKAKGIFGQVEAKVKKMFGKASGIVMMILNKVFKFDTESIGKSLSGSKEKGVAMTGLILGFFGIKKGAAMFGGAKLDQKGMDGIIESGKQAKGLDKQTIVSESVKLTGKKIVIPKGKGIQPGGKLKVKMDGREVELDKKEAKAGKPEEKMKKGLFGLFGGGGEEEENVQLKDNEIIIEKDTVIPKDTIIPKGAKVIKV